MCGSGGGSTTQAGHIFFYSRGSNFNLVQFLDIKSNTWILEQ